MNILQKITAPLLVAGAALVACSTPVPTAPSQTDLHAESETIYTCPMHPEIRSPHPGQCPICGMTLVPMAPSTPSGPTTMKLDIRSAERAGLHNSPATRTTMYTEVRADGDVSFADSRVRDIPVRTGGWVRELGAGRPGDTLRSGQTMLILESPELEAAQRDYATLIAQSGADSPLARTFALRLRTMGLSESQLQALAQGGKPQRLVPLAAPYGGLVIARDIQVGQLLEPGMNILRIADLAEVWIEARIFQDDLPHVAPGMSASIWSPGHGAAMEGKVQRILPEMHASSRTATVRIVVRNSEINLHPGAVVIVRIRQQHPDTLSIPRDAVIWTGDSALVFVDHGQGRIEPRTVTTGIATDTRYEILSGLQVGERVVDSAVFLVAAESRLRYSRPYGPETTANGHEH